MGLSAMRFHAYRKGRDDNGGEVRAESRLSNGTYYERKWFLQRDDARREHLNRYMSDEEWRQTRNKQTKKSG